MIKVIIGYKQKKGEDIRPLLLKLRTSAMQYQGFVSAENLFNDKDSSLIILISTWETSEYWRLWEESKIKQQLQQQIETLLKQKPRVTSYHIMPTRSWK